MPVADASETSGLAPANPRAQRNRKRPQWHRTQVALASRRRRYSHSDAAFCVRRSRSARGCPQKIADCRRCRSPPCYRHDTGHSCRAEWVREHYRVCASRSANGNLAWSLRACTENISIPWPACCGTLRRIISSLTRVLRMMSAESAMHPIYLMSLSAGLVID